MDNISILIKTLLQPVNDADIAKFKAKLQQQIGNVNVNNGKGIKLLNQAEIDIYIQKLQNSLSRMQFKTPKVFDNAQVKDEVNKLNAEFDKLRNNATSIKQVGLQFDNLKTKVTEVSSTLRNTNKDGYNFIQMLELAGKKIAIWGISTQLIYGTWRALKDGLETLKELDGLLVDVAKVTDLSTDALDRLKKSAFDTASAYGRTAQDYLRATAEFSRAGYEEQAEGLSQISLLAQNVGELTAEQANQFLLATDAAYKYVGSQEELGRVLDGVNQIDNKFATSIQKVSEGISVSASIASNASVGVNELSAAVGTMTAVTQRSGKINIAA